MRLQISRGAWIRAFRFGVTGIFNTGLHALIVIALVELLQTPAPAANGVAFVCATLISFVINTLWSFAAPMRRTTLIKFFAVSMIGFGTTVLVSWSVQAAGFAYLWGVLAVALTVPPVTFLLHSFWTYR